MRSFLVPFCLACTVGFGWYALQRAQADEIETHSQCAAETDSACTRCRRGSCQRAAALARTGLRPYRIQAPDVLIVNLTDVEAEAHESGAGDGATLRAANLQLECLVGPDGKVEVGGQSVYVAGMTVDRARKAIEKACPQFANYGNLHIEVREKNSKAVYLVVENQRGDNVLRMPCDLQTTVREVLSDAIWPQPIDLADCEIEVRRVTDSFGDRQEIIPVEWTTDEGQPSGVLNLSLLPGDRIFVTEPEASPIRAAPRAAHPQSPPLLQPPAPVVEESQVATNATQIVYRVQVLEDPHDNLAELGSLRDGFLAGDKETLLGAVRILKKNKLVRVLAQPTLAATAGQEVQLRVGSETPSGDFQGTELKIKGATWSDAIQLDLALTVEYDQKKFEIDASAIVDRGETVVFGRPGKCPVGENAQLCKYSCAKSTCRGVRYYVVVTPEQCLPD